MKPKTTWFLNCVIGYSEGSLRANDATFTSGGQCEDGLKMIFVIGRLEVSTTELQGNNHSLIKSQIARLKIILMI